MQVNSSSCYFNSDMTDKKKVRMIPYFSHSLVPRVGVEPTWIAPHDFESCASANSAIRGCFNSITYLNAV